MVTTPNLGITHLESNQNQPEVTVNAAIDQLDNAMNREFSITVTGNVVIAAVDFNANHRFVLSGSPSADFLVTIPANQRVFSLQNDTAKVATVENVASPTGNTVEVQPYSGAIIQSDSYEVTIDGREFFISGFISGTASSDQAMLRFMAPFDFTIKADAPGSQASVGTNPLDGGSPSQAVFTLEKNDSSFGDCTITDPGGFVFHVASDTSFVRGTDVLSIGAPFTADSALADINITLAGVRIS